MCKALNTVSGLVSVWQMLLCTSSKSLPSFLSHSCRVRWPNASTHLGQTLLDGPTVLCLGWYQRISLWWEEISSDCGLISTKLLGYSVADIIEPFRTCTFPSFYSLFAFVYSMLIVDVHHPDVPRDFFFLFWGLIERNLIYVRLLLPPPLPVVVNL